jgi:hypothetical protein
MQKTLSAETRAKISAAKRGKPLSPEAIARRPKKRSAETRARIAESLRRIWAERPADHPARTRILETLNRVRRVGSPAVVLGSVAPDPSRLGNQSIEELRAKAARLEARGHLKAAAVILDYCARASGRPVRPSQ